MARGRVLNATAGILRRRRGGGATAHARGMGWGESNRWPARGERVLAGFMMIDVRALLPRPGRAPYVVCAWTTMMIHCVMMYPTSSFLFGVFVLFSFLGKLLIVFLQ